MTTTAAVQVNGNTVAARTLRALGADSLFWLSGAPMGDFARACLDEGLRGVDVRHEQAAAMAAHAYARLTRKPGLCSAASGPGMTNLITGMANAYSDAAPVIAFGGASSTFLFNSGDFQELDQLPMMKPATKWADRLIHTHRIPETIALAYRLARTGKPGPVYLDVPGNVIYGELDERTVQYPERFGDIPRPLANPADVRRAIDVLAAAERPIVIAGSGVLWSEAWDELRVFVETTGIPFFTTPIARGLLPEDHPLSFLAARNQAFREADAVLVVGTRLNFIIGYGESPRFRADARFILVNIDPGEERNRRVDVAVIGDARMALGQLTDEASGRVSLASDCAWIDGLRAKDRANAEKAEALMNSDAEPIHPLRLCKEIRDFLDRDAILSVDGHQTLNFARQTIPTHSPGHRLNAGPFGCMGVAIPFALGAKAARPDKQVMALSGDGSFGFNGFEIDTAVRHGLPFVTVVLNNGGWTGGPNPGERWVPGRDLGFQHYDRIGEAMGAYGERVTEPREIRPALERAFRTGRPAVLNVICQPKARIGTGNFAMYKYANIDVI